MLPQKEFVWSLLQHVRLGETGVVLTSEIPYRNEYEPTPQSVDNFTVIWIACCNRGKSCCVKPLIFVNRQIGMYKSLPTGFEEPRKSPYYSVWIEVDGKVYDPYKTGDANSDLPRLGGALFGISQSERRYGTLIQYKYDMQIPSETLLDAIGVPKDVRNQFPYLLSTSDIYRCGSSEKPICFPVDNSTHVVKVCIQQLRPIGEESVEYRYKIEKSTVVSCEPCEYKVYTRVTQQHSNKSDPRADIPPKCTVSVYLETKGGINGTGCVGGYEWIKSGDNGGRWWSGDDTTELRINAMSSKPLLSGLIATLSNVSGSWSDTIRLFDVCGNVLAEIPVVVNCYETDSEDSRYKRIPNSRP